MLDDFGSFGKDLDGYINYMYAFKESQKGGGGGKKPPSNSGCLTSLAFALAFILVITALLSY
ncbi:MAG: hypothetical protein GX488_03540 [Clostridiales bacterium]|nr:hypothetical protein [Clostridiales bacterium]